MVARIALLLSIATALDAQDVVGRYSTKNPQGNTVVLSLEADGPGKVKGSLTGNGIAFTLAGEIRGGDATGMMRNAQGAAMFEAHREGNQLRMILVELGADGRPNYATGREVLFTVDNAAPAQAGSAEPTAGNPLARKPDDRFVGTFTGNDVTLTLRKTGASYEGTITTQGQSMPATATAANGALTGKFSVQGAQSYDFTVQAAGENHVNLITAGTTYMLARSGGTGNPLAGGAAASTPGGAGGGSADDERMRQLFTSTAWCTFSYSGGSTYTGGSYGTSSRTRTVLRADGSLTQTGGSENTNTGSAGNVYGSSSSGTTAYWRFENGQFAVSADRVNWTPVRFEMTYNSNGAPIPKLDGREYMRCQ